MTAVTSAPIATTATVCPAPRSGSLEHQLCSQWSCRMQRGDSSGGSKDLRSLYRSKDQIVREVLHRFCAHLSEKDGETYNHRCLFVFPTSILSLPDQLAEFGGVIDDSLAASFPQTPLFPPSPQPHLLVGVEIAHTIKELPQFNQRCAEQAGHWLSAKEWVAVLRFRKETRHLHEPVNAVKGVLLRESDGSFIACVWRRPQSDSAARPYWFRPTSSLGTSHWLMPWCHDRIPLHW